MAGSFDFDPYAAPLASPAADVGVYRYDPSQAGDLRYTLVPNVCCQSIQQREGPEPPVASFRYLLDDSDPSSGLPSQFEQLWPLAADGPYVLRNDERVVVLAGTPWGGVRVLFDGFVQVPSVALTPGSQEVSLLAVGVAIRAWDNPIGGRLERNADDPYGGDVVPVDLPTRFNPDGRPNCTPDGQGVSQADPSKRYPAFIDPNLSRNPDPRAFWTLGKFARYILAVHNDGRYIKNPDFTPIDAMLQARSPLAGAGFLDPADSGEYASNDVSIRDFDATNMPWPEALALQLGYAGFGMRFVTSQDGEGAPRTELEFYRKDAGRQTAPLDLELPTRGADLDPARCNVASLHLTRDARSIVNAISVETPPRRVEVSVVLAAGFTPAAGDESAGSRVRFLRANLSTADGDARRKYRVYVADEAGDGHWDNRSGAWTTSALDLSAIFPPGDGKRPSYARRLRPGSMTLLSRDSAGRPLRAQLALSRDYNGLAPALWDGSGTWQPITSSWDLLEDRLGILVTAEDPESWPIGEYTGPSPQEASRTLRGVTSQANPSPPNTRFFLRLTTVIDDDLMLPAVLGPRPASPTTFTLRRRIDARDHFRMETIAARSLYNPGSTAVVVRDDTELALAHARQLQAAHEFPPLTGSVTVPSLVTAFRVGDRIARINGRDISFQTSIGAGQGESPAYPVVVGLTWDFTGQRQATVLGLADRPSQAPQSA
ncbi:hypothetical protein OJF2_72440 [Aquisphaera giovannonii]|uniref:Uncharacterized protein n=1 Tax=Aquisphaera giovannonii TaxID=406548 RepID=A0A5B9WD91_9BACT|nr:hypothetical protein [Aquisphaera giovannonii]QEH38638.1 hypothetical protein OJF2_72440 [Aquisphaera giovannonii]